MTVLSTAARLNSQVADDLDNDGIVDLLIAEPAVEAEPPLPG